jgi:hypothetical protein
MELQAFSSAGMKSEQISVLRQVAAGQPRPAGEDRVVSRTCGGLVNRGFLVKTGTCWSHNDTGKEVAVYEVTPAGLAYLNTFDAGPAKDLLDGEESPPEYISTTLRRLATGAADHGDVANVVRRAVELELSTVRLTVWRASEVRSNKGGTMRLLGRDGPRSSEDVTPRRVDDTTWTAAWMVADLKLWLKSVPQRPTASASLAAARQE